MNSNDRKTLIALTQGKAPRDLKWEKFVTLWKAIADKVEDESGDRLSVTMNGHREVFRRAHDGIVSIEDVENARKLLKEHPELKGSGHALALTIDAKQAHLYDFDLAEQTTADSQSHVTDEDTRSHHLRTVERHSGNDDEADLKHFLDETTQAAVQHFGRSPFVVFGHGKGKADVASQFVERFARDESERRDQIVALVDIDLSAVTPTQLEQATQSALAQA